MALGAETSTTKALWDTMARGVRKNKKRQDQIRQSSKFLPHLNAYMMEADGTVFVEMVQQIARGLYWHCYHEHLPPTVQIDARLMQMGEWIVEHVDDMARAIVGGDQFFYAYKRMDEHPTISVWIFVFHRRIVGMALTDVELADRLESQLSV